MFLYSINYYNCFSFSNPIFTQEELAHRCYYELDYDLVVQGSPDYILKDKNGFNNPSTSNKSVRFNVALEDRVETDRNSDVEEAEGRTLRLLAFSAAARDEWLESIRHGVGLLQSSLDVPPRPGILRQGGVS